MTRAEKIRQMDDVELAEYLCSVVSATCRGCVFAGGRNSDFPAPCGALEYLHEEVEE